MEQYHGTSKIIANNITSGLIDVTLGGGELGQGFYSGDLQHEAHNWAWMKHKKDGAVVRFTVDDDDIIGLNVLCLDYTATVHHRASIKQSGKTRSYLFNKDVLWAPVVGRSIPNFNQFKYESKTAELYLNSTKVAKKIE